MAAWKNKGARYERQHGRTREHIMNGCMEEQGAHYEWQHGRARGHIMNRCMEEQGGMI